MNFHVLKKTVWNSKMSKCRRHFLAASLFPTVCESATFSTCFTVLLLSCTFLQTHRRRSWRVDKTLQFNCRKTSFFWKRTLSFSFVHPTVPCYKCTKSTKMGVRKKLNLFIFFIVFIKVKIKRGCWEERRKKKKT